VDEFLENLRAVFERMRRFNVKLKPLKCSFGYKELVFCGHVFKKEGYQLCEDKKSNILQLGVPRNLKDVRRMLGMVNFFRDFIPNLSVLVKPHRSDVSADVCLVGGGTEDLAGREGSCGSGGSLA